MKTKSNLIESERGILTVGQLIDTLKTLDRETMVVVGNDSWYDNIEGFYFPDETEEWTCVTFIVGSPYDTRQG